MYQAIGYMFQSEFVTLVFFTSLKLGQQKRQVACYVALLATLSEKYRESGEMPITRRLLGKSYVFKSC